MKEISKAKSEKVVDGRSVSGKTRMASLSTDERRELGKRAAMARWNDAKELKVATHMGQFSLGDAAVPLQCAVLEDGTRVLTQGDFLRAIGRQSRPKSSAEVTDSVGKAAPFLEADNLQSYISDELREASLPFMIRLPDGGRAWGYRADILPQVCTVYLKANDDKVLLHTQKATAKACDILVRALAHVGIIALVDEATGYERDREKNALANILEAFIAKELQPYVKTFPAEYYENLFRLRGVKFSAASVKRPQYFGHLTNDIIYYRLAPGILHELKKSIPRNDQGKAKAHLFRLLTANVGYPKLREHLGAAVALMRVSTTYAEFLDLMNRLYPRYEGLEQPSLLDDDGTGI